MWSTVIVCRVLSAADWVLAAEKEYRSICRSDAIRTRFNLRV
jgi:hypothetical protein